MNIVVVSGVAEGVTKVAAFDAALQVAGIADRNLIRLSSIIPPHAVVQERYSGWVCPGEYGDRLYVVLADAYQRGLDLCSAGVGWKQRPDGSGIFVEAKGLGPATTRYTEMMVTLKDMGQLRGGKWGRSCTVEVEAQGTGVWSCTLVAAVYLAEGW